MIPLRIYMDLLSLVDKNIAAALNMHLMKRKLGTE